MFIQLQQKIQEGDVKALARCISLIENETTGYARFLESLPPKSTPIIGITGPPGAGKSTLVDALIECMVKEEKKVAVLCVDPSSPFNLGALLGDRIRMSSWYNHPAVFIRSLATRGSLGGLHPKIIEITDVLKAAFFDYIMVETVGVGQSEIEIAGLADATVVVLVPEAGDEVQTMKAGLMEIADVFVVNKADRPGADLFIKNLRQLVTPAAKGLQRHIPVFATVAQEHKGITELLTEIKKQLGEANNQERKYWLLTEKAYTLILQHRMKAISRQILFEDLKQNKISNVYKYLNQKNWMDEAVG
jgi:LAO/AO transport system kinase